MNVMKPPPRTGVTACLNFGCVWSLTGQLPERQPDRMRCLYCNEPLDPGLVHYAIIDLDAMPGDDDVAYLCDPDCGWLDLSEGFAVVVRPADLQLELELMFG
jgi:hypothetical protein